MRPVTAGPQSRHQKIREEWHYGTSDWYKIGLVGAMRGRSARYWGRRACTYEDEDEDEEPFFAIGVAIVTANGQAMAYPIVWL